MSENISKNIPVVRIRGVDEINSSTPDENNAINTDDNNFSLDNNKRKLPLWLEESTEELSSTDSSSHKKCKSSEERYNENICDSTKQSASTENIVDSTEISKENSTDLEVPSPVDKENTQFNDISNVRVNVKQEVKTEPSDSTDAQVSSSTSSATNVVKQEASSSLRDSCQYGVRCYRRNPLHRMEMAHPGDADYRRPTYPSPPPGTPLCPYGENCYRRNPSHFQEYSHSIKEGDEQNKKPNIRKHQKTPNKAKKASVHVVVSYDDDDDDEYEDFNDPFGTDSEDDYEPSDDDFDDEQEI